MKKGFTLVELLAVIAVLAIIALIAVPVIVGIIIDAKKRAAVLSGEQYIKAVNYKITQEEINGRPVTDGEYIIGEDEIDVEIKSGDSISGGYLIDASEVTWAGLCINKYSVGYYDGKAFIESSTNYCLEDAYAFVEPPGILMNLICEDPSLYNTESRFKLKTAEDLACFTNTVSEGKNFSGKEVYLLSDIDIASTSSYTAYTTKKYGDINGNGTTEALFTELNTGAGFKPIGTNGKPFSGTFLGYAFTISNLKINRTTDYNGLFGYSTGTISGVKLRNIDITGKSYVGSVVGYSTTVIKNVDVQGKVKGTDRYIGGIVGYLENNSADLYDFMFSGTVEGNNYVGGAIGQNRIYRGSGVVYNTTITSPGSYVGKSSTNTNTVNVMVSNTNIVHSGSRSSSFDGTAFNDITISAVDGALDTYIGGDNNKDGYYFDYDNDGVLTLYSIDRTPTRANKLKGSGTENSPYLIKNVKDWKYATATIDGTAKYYRVMANIDFTNKTFYPMGTGTNKFVGTFDGDFHTISNVGLIGFNYAGVFGYNSGTVKNLNLNNISIQAQNNYGGLIGYNAGTITGIKARGVNVTGTNDIGGLAGYNSAVIHDVDIKGNITGTGSYIGGIAGYQEGSGATLDEFIYSGNVEGNNYVGGVIGQNRVYKGTGIVYNTTVTAPGSSVALSSTNTNTVNVRVSNSTLVHSGSRSSSFDGNAFNQVTLSSVDEILDTYVGGDNDGDGYYFDYNANGVVELYSLKEKPIKVSLTGAGTESNPYLIRTTEDWRMATATIGETPKYYKLTNNIDFTNIYFYPMGTNSVKFNGVFDGESHTISNATIHSYQYGGAIGYNTGTIQNINFNNVAVDNYSETAGLIGYNSGTVDGIKARNITVTGARYLGGVVGNNVATVKNVDVQSTVTGTGDRIGGVVGNNTGTVKQFMVKTNATGGNGWISGAVGFNGGNSSAILGIVYDSVVTGTGSIAKLTTYNGGTARVSNTELVLLGGSRQYCSDGTPFDKVTISSVDGILDTYIGGDEDGDGYYFDYNNSGKLELYSTKEKPIRITLSGAGTAVSPYLIRNAEDWRMATATIGEVPKYYKLSNDIDFTNKNFYPMGTGAIKFNGELNGDSHIVSNIAVYGYDQTGVSANNTGTIKNIRLNNVIVNTYTSTAGIVGYNTGTLNGIKARNVTVTGVGELGGLVGYNKGNIKNIDVQSTVTGTSSREAGVVASMQGGTLTDFVVSTNVTGGYNTGGAIGNNGVGTGTGVGLVYDSTVTSTAGSVGLASTYNGAKNIMVNNSTLVHEGGREWSSDGTAIPYLSINSVDAVLDTIIGGDSDGDGYYFDYNNAGKIELYSTIEKPLTNTLSGAGTEASPYLITNTNDWKIATSTISEAKYYRLTNDLDFTNTEFYQMGTGTNTFKGVLDGDHHTISNVTIYGYNKTGIVGHNTGTVKNLNFNNVTINNGAETSGIVAYNTGTINGIKARNLSISGGSSIYSTIGGISGVNTGSIKNVDVQGNFVGTANLVGGIIGTLTSTGTLENFAFTGSVTGPNIISGAVGKNETGYWTTITGVVYDTTITCNGNGSACAKAAYYNGPKNVKIYNTQLIKEGNREWSYDGTEISEKTLEAVNDAMDTTINGDDDGDGYYFTLNNGMYELITAN